MYSDGTLADTCMKLTREETKIMVTGRSFYRKNNLKFKGRKRNRSRNRPWEKKLGPGTYAKWHGPATLPKRLIFLKKSAKHWHSLWIAFVEIGNNWFLSQFTERSVLNQSFSLRQIVYEYQLWSHFARITGQFIAQLPTTSELVFINFLREEKD